MDNEQTKLDWENANLAVKLGIIRTIGWQDGQGHQEVDLKAAILYAAARIEELEKREGWMANEHSKLAEAALKVQKERDELREELENERLRLAVCAAESDMALIDQIVALRKENAELQQAQRWVPVGNEIAPENAPVLISCNSVTFPIVGKYCGDGLWRSQDGWKKDDVTHWKPLPDAPQLD